jgi:LuxR family maltose regulon positive regulatory protein
METARQLALKSESTQLDDLAAALAQAHLWISQGEAASATRWFEERGIDPSALPASQDAFPEAAQGIYDGVGEDSVASRMRKYEHLVLVRLLLAQGRSADALALLEPLSSMVEALQRIDLLIDVRILRTLALQQQGRFAEAVASLEGALSLAEPGGYVRVFVDGGEPMVSLLTEILEGLQRQGHDVASRGVTPEYVSNLLAALGAPETAGQGAILAADKAQPLIEPLSERELQVLRLLGSGLSNPEIARELIVSVHTVRSHVKNIYGKLDVHRRWDAVQRGKELGLI